MILNAILKTLRDPRNDPGNDPVKRTRNQLNSHPISLEKLETAVRSEIESVLETALGALTK
jgi:hypothetical protein